MNLKTNHLPQQEDTMVLEDYIRILYEACEKHPYCNEADIREVREELEGHLADMAFCQQIARFSPMMPPLLCIATIPTGRLSSKTWLHVIYIRCWLREATCCCNILLTRAFMMKYILRLAINRLAHHQSPVTSLGLRLPITSAPPNPNAWTTTYYI